MTRRHFIAIAAELRKQRPDSAKLCPSYLDRTPWERGAYDEWATIVIGMAGVLSTLGGLDVNGNRRFDRDRFLTACGLAS